MRPDGLPLWVSAVEPGSTHDLTDARAHALGALSAAAARGLPTLADGGDPGAGQGMHTPVLTPKTGQRLDVDSRTYNLLLRALLTQRWRVLQYVTACPHTISDLAKAALVLTHIEHRHLSC